ncbi:carbohydrate kinase family protein [Patescibacteria group bacterium]
MRDIITIGSAIRDVFLVSDQFKILKTPKIKGGVAECVPLGSKIEIKTIVHTTGGGATNAAVTFSNLGYKTSTICRIGDDDEGQSILNALKKYQIDTKLIKQIPKGTTGYSTLLTEPGGERSILVYRGVSSKFSENDIPWHKCLAKWFYLSSLGGNLNLSKKIVKYAAGCGAKIAWNPGGSEIDKGLKAFAPVLDDVAILLMNKEEAYKLTETKNITAMLNRLSTPGNVVIITDGSKGAYARKDKETYFAATTGKKSVSRAGAGDAFGSGFVASYMKDNDLTKALATGTLNAEGVIGSIGAKLGILTSWPTSAQIKKVKIKKI